MLTLVESGRTRTAQLDSAWGLYARWDVEVWGEAYAVSLLYRSKNGLVVC